MADKQELERLLNELARDLVDSGVMHLPDKKSPFYEICVRALSDVFTSRLLPILEAGQAMWQYLHNIGANTDEEDEWIALLAKALGEKVGGDGEQGEAA